MIDAVQERLNGWQRTGSVSYTHLDVYKRQAHTLNSGGFTVYTRLPGPVSEEQSAQNAKLEALSCLLYTSRCV